MSGFDAARPLSINSQSNVFLAISSQWRMVIIVYFIFWKIIPSFVSLILHNSNQPYIFLQIIIDTTNTLLLLYPFTLYHLGGIPIGWLHPLVYSNILFQLINILRKPETILYPIIVWFAPINESYPHSLLLSYSDEALSWVHLKGGFLIFLALLSTYIGFLSIRIKVPQLRLRPPRYIGVKLLIIFSCMLFLSMVIFQTSGGIIAHMSSFGMGRHRILGESGHITGIIAFASPLLIIWYIFDRRILKKPWYLALFFMALMMQFAVSGSRAGTVMPLIILTTVWIFHHRRIPKVPLLVIGFLGWIMIGVLGEIRTSTMSNSVVDFSAITQFDFAKSLEYTKEHMSTRVSEDVFLPTIALVPDTVDYLWGETYVGVITAFIPRWLWPEKPRGVDAYAGAIIVEGRNNAKGYVGAAAPPGAVAEAYWNFGVFGVSVIFFLYGVFLRWLARVMLKYFFEPAVVAFYLFSLFYLNTPGGPEMIRYLHTMAFLTIIYYFLGIFKVSRRLFYRLLQK